jgi:plasmid stabilization system protein ParE
VTSYTVEWRPSAENDLADIWLGATDRAAVTAAEATINRLLSNDPVHYGAHVAEGLYKLRADPLTVFYTIDLARRLVEVTQAVRTAP